jgi:hypothetical protein
VEKEGLDSLGIGNAIVEDGIEGERNREESVRIRDAKKCGQREHYCRQIPDMMIAFGGKTLSTDTH